MQNLSAIERLDAVLAYFIINPEKHFQVQSIADYFNINVFLYRGILNGLIDDRYIKESILPLPIGSRSIYAVTFDGRYFYENCGYKEQKRLEGLKNALAEKKEKIASRREKMLI